MPSLRKRNRGGAGRRPLRAGLYGILGAGNLGNDAALEAVLGFLRRDHPDAQLTAMTTTPEDMSARYGIPAQPLSWQHPWKHPYLEPVSGLSSAVFLLTGKIAQTVRTARWVARQDVVIVPGAGVMETSLPMRPWEMPYSLFTMCLAGRLFRTPVAMVSIGAEPVRRRKTTRALLNLGARLAGYRSFRDEGSRSSMGARGIDVSGDHVFADMVFSLPVPAHDDGAPGTVGLGVMEYTGSNDDDRAQAEAIYGAYEAAMKDLVRRLADSGRRVTLLVGDQCDYSVAQALIEDIRVNRPDLPADVVQAAPTQTFTELMEAIAPLNVVVAARFHNLVAALKLGKPTISIDYAVKSTDLMTDMALAQFTHPIRALSVDRLMADIEEAEETAAQLRPKILEACASKVELTQRQFAELTGEVFPAA